MSDPAVSQRISENVAMHLWSEFFLIENGSVFKVTAKSVSHQFCLRISPGARPPMIWEKHEVEIIKCEPVKVNMRGKWCAKSFAEYILYTYYNEYVGMISGEVTL